MNPPILRKINWLGVCRLLRGAEGSHNRIGRRGHVGAQTGTRGSGSGISR